MDLLHLRCQAFWLHPPAPQVQSWGCVHSMDTLERTLLHTKSCPRAKQTCSMLDNEAPTLNWVLQNKPGPAPCTASLATQIYSENGASFINGRFNSHFSVLCFSSAYNIYYAMKTWNMNTISSDILKIFSPLKDLVAILDSYS